MSSNILLSLKNLFGYVPRSVQDQMKYFTYDESSQEFTCTLCDKVIKKYASKTLEAHLSSKSHRGCTGDEVTQALTVSFLGKIPQIVQNNIDVLDVAEEGYECVICSKMLKIGSNPEISFKNFSYHLTSTGHEENLQDHYEKIDHLTDVYGVVPAIVSNNAEFIQLDHVGRNYECKLCDVKLKVNKKNIECTKNSFERHFYSSIHRWGVKWSKVLSLIPELKHSKSTIHVYLMRNIDYITKNGTELFCSLCQENIIRSQHNVNETEENLKSHILSSLHEENMFNRQNEGNVKLDNLKDVNGVFTDAVLKSLRYLQLSDNTLTCSVCNEEIYTESDCDERDDNIIFHLESELHESNVSEEEERQTDLKENLEGIFGSISPMEENLIHIEFVQGNVFRCSLCNTNLLSKNLERHLNTKRHTQALEDISESLHEGFEELLGEDYQIKIPVCVKDNWCHIEYENESGDFCCTLCNKTIIVDEGTKWEEITLQNFKTHLLSVGHVIKLKEKATKVMKITEMLKHIFGEIPKCVLSNMYVLNENDDDSFYCDECDVTIQRGTSTETTKKNFLQHLRGSCHQSNIENIETSIDNAYKYLDEKFCIPEFLLGDIDFWDNSVTDSDLYCSLCQTDLSVDLDDLKQSRQILECHVNSEWHKFSLNNL